MKFSEFGFHEDLMQSLSAMGFNDPTPVQELAIPPILEKKDVVAVAQTGTGKTAAFLLPIINDLTEHPSDDICTLILEPTRELAIQVDQQLEGFSYFTPVSAIPVYGGRGGRSMELEKRALKKGANIIVATPGRLMAHLDLGYVNFDNLRYLILDEADRMLDMGFAPDIMTIVNHIPRKRQTLLFSATMPPEIRKFSRQLMASKPVEVSIAISKPAENIMQAAYEVADSGKIALTEHLLKGKELQRVLIFAGTKNKVRDLASTLHRKGMKVGAMHSDLEQSEREERIREFKSGTLPIVVATDVMSRGIDIKGIDVVINYDVPGDAEDYVHRIGRTARADASGVALTFINHHDRGRIRRIEDLIESKIKRLPLPPDIPEARSSSGGRSGGSRGGNRRKGRGRGRNKGRGGRGRPKSS